MTPPALLGTYHPPRVRHGQKVWCEYRGAWCRITSWTDAPIPWPRCNQIGVQGGSGLWVNETLRKAIETESAEALKFWFGVGPNAVWRWRKAFDVSHFGTAGSKALHEAASHLGAEAVKAKDWTDEELDAKSETSKRIGLSPPNRWAKTGWTLEELVLLGTATDREVAAMVGRSEAAVRAMRARKRVPKFGAG